jgi:hypothetical protein
MEVRMMLLEYGFIPPEDGPLRDQFLESNGLNHLRSSHDSLSEVMRILGPLVTSMPKIPVSRRNLNGQQIRDRQVWARKAWRSFRKTISPAALTELEPHLRAAESSAVTAFNYLEDHPERGDAHRSIHKAGFVRGGLLGCPIMREKDQFWTDCAVNISHCRLGASVGMTSDFACSVCGLTVEDCDHIMGAAYSLVMTHVDGRCNVCFNGECVHEPGRTYEVIANPIGVNAILAEVSLVRRPRYPGARINRMTMDIEKNDAIYQMALAGQVQCDICVGACGGMRDSLR